MNPPTSGCLAGLRVLDLSRVLAGPFCTQLLGDMGAEIIKVERPGSGDDTRQWGPPWFHGESAYFLSCNRNKKSLTLNLKSAQGRELIKKLAAQSDVLVENFKTGEMTKLGLDYASLQPLNPGLIYCAITGYGQNGPYADRPGYDFIIQAQGGVMSITGEAEGEPCKVGVAIADVMAGMYAANAILGALAHRHKTGAGQFIDIALLDSQVSWLINVAMNYLVSGQAPRRYGNAHPNLAPYQAFATADGQIAIGVGNDEQFRRLCLHLDLAEMAQDPKFANNAQRLQHRDAMTSRLQNRLREKSTEEWLAILLAAQIPVSAINSIPQILQDPQVLARDMVRTIQHPAGDLRVLGPVAKFSETPSNVYAPPPLLGQHTEEILKDLLDFDTEKILALRESGAI
ncbi:CoA transferase [candidate division KSB1 bacterium]|nr:MAG: CoA transferase [candidate division KSB1 bacterium]MCE7941966.1 CoA transferase [Chlorobi bacterium CHB1]MDL1878833.1 CoA transferase [Cytophagia bacterium CHB2]